MGILVALVWPWIVRLRRAVPLLELFGIAALVGSVLLFRQMQDFNPTLYRGGDLAAAFCFAVLVAAVAHPKTGIGEALGVAPLRWVGERSYGIYLWHWPIIVLVAGVNAPERRCRGRRGSPRPRGRRALVPVRRAADPDGAPAAVARAAPAPLPARGHGRGSGGARRGLRDPVRDASLAEPGLGYVNPPKAKAATHHEQQHQRTRTVVSHQRPHAEEEGRAAARPDPRAGRLGHARLLVRAEERARAPGACRRDGGPADRGHGQRAADGSADTTSCRRSW